MKVFVILLVLIGISLSHSNLPDAEARTVAPLSIFLEDATIKQNSFITADGGVPDITIQKGETVSFPLKVSSRGLEPLPVNFFHSIELAIPDTHQATLPDMKIELEPFYMILNPDKPQIMNVTITTLNYTQLGEHKVTVTAQYPQGEPLLNTRFDVLVIDENQFVKFNDDFKYPVPGGGIIAHLYSLKTQIESGLSYDELRCNEGHVLIQKYDGSPACIKPESKTKLVERGWTSTNGVHDAVGSSNGHWKLKTEVFVATSLKELTPIDTVNVDGQYSATAILTKPHGMSDQHPELGYVMYVQVLDPNGDWIAGSWHHGIIKTNQTISAGTYWSPKDAGNYTIEVFAWQSFTGTPHADVSRHTVEVTE